MAVMINEPVDINPDTIEWQLLLNKLTQICGGFLLIDFTNMDNDKEPFVVAGTRLEVNGSYYKVPLGDEGITGWGAIPVGSTAYIYCVPADNQTAYWQYDIQKPLFRVDLGGWFHPSLNKRAVGSVYKSAANMWTDKKILGGREEEPVMGSVEIMETTIDVSKVKGTLIHQLMHSNLGNCQFTLNPGVYWVYSQAGGGGGGNGGSGGAANMQYGNNSGGGGGGIGMGGRNTGICERIKVLRKSTFFFNVFNPDNGSNGYNGGAYAGGGGGKGGQCGIALLMTDGYALWVQGGAGVGGGGGGGGATSGRPSAEGGGGGYPPVHGSSGGIGAYNNTPNYVAKFISDSPLIDFNIPAIQRFLKKAQDIRPGAGGGGGSGGIYEGPYPPSGGGRGGDGYTDSGGNNRMPECAELGQAGIGYITAESIIRIYGGE